MILEKWWARAVLSLLLAGILNEVLRKLSNGRTEINGLVVGFIFYILISLGFGLYLRYKMHQEIKQEPNDELLDD